MILIPEAVGDVEIGADVSVGPDHMRNAGQRIHRHARSPVATRPAVTVENQRGINIILAQRHIRTIFAVEYQRKLFPVANAQQYQRRQPVRVGHNTPHINAFAL